MSTRGFVISLLVGVLVAVSAGAARADDDLESRAAARALFEEGVAHADAGRWPEAADRFERARVLRPTPEITYNLTTALVHQGMLVRASELLRPVVAEPKATPAVKEAAAARLAGLLPQLSHLTIEIPGGGHGLSVLVDRRPFDATRLGVALPMDPGTHRLDVRQGEALVERREIILREGERRTVTLLKDPPPRSALAFAPAVQTSPAEVTPASSSHRRRWVWAVVGALAVGVTTTALLTSRDSSAPPAGNVDTWMLGH